MAEKMHKFQVYVQNEKLVLSILIIRIKKIFTQIRVKKILQRHFNNNDNFVSALFFQDLKISFVKARTKTFSTLRGGVNLEENDKFKFSESPNKFCPSAAQPFKFFFKSASEPHVIIFSIVAKNNLTQ